MSRVQGIVTGLDGTSFGIELRDATVETQAARTAAGYDESGRQTELHLVSVRRILRCRGFASGSERLTTGDTIEYDGRTYLVTSSALLSESGEFQTYRITAEQSDEASASGL